MASLNDTHHALIAKLCKGDESATAFLIAIAEVLHFWDDLIDRDKRLDDATIHECMIAALIELPRNAFYRAHFDVLNSLLIVAIQNWKVANTLECQGESDERMVAFILRSSYVDLFTMTATIVGGIAWGEEMAWHVRRLAHAEGFAFYLVALENEKQCRQNGSTVEQPGGPPNVLQ